MRITTIVATAVMLFGHVPYAAAQSLATSSGGGSAPEPLTGLVLGLGLIGLRFLRRH